MAVFQNFTLNVFDNTRCTLGESARWDNQRQRLVWLDIKSKLLFSKRTSNANADVVRLVHFAGAIFFIASDKIGMTYANGLYSVKGGKITCEAEFDLIDTLDVRMNDARVDPFGNLIFGTMDLQECRPLGRLSRASPSYDLSLLIDNIVICNGPAFNSDGSKMYFSDSVNCRVFQYDYGTDGIVKNSGKIFVQLDAGVCPDGLTVDCYGNVFVACWGGSCVLGFDLKGVMIAKLTLPTKNVTSCCFGGPDLSTLYVTTAAEISRTGDVIDELGGMTFFCETGTKGIEETLFGQRPQQPHV